MFRDLIVDYNWLTYRYLMQIKSLYIYPVKSLHGIKVDCAKATELGFEWDREFMLVDKAGKFVTQRLLPKMATIYPAIDQQNLIFTHLQDQLVHTPVNDGQLVETQLWKSRPRAIDQGDKVATWFSKILGYDLRLVKIDKNHPRIKQSDTLGKDIPVSFADGYPYLLTTTGSLAQLQSWVREANQQNDFVLPMSRFRPNIVIDNKQPFAEEKWQNITLGDTKFQIVKKCERCVITTTDQTTGIRDAFKYSVLQSLATNKKDVSFGVNLILKKSGLVETHSLVATSH